MARADIGRELEAGEDPAEDDLPMTIWEHLRELRTRLIRSVLALIPTSMIAWEYKEQLLSFLVQPLIKAWVALGLGEPTLHFANPVDPFMAYMQIAVVVGFIGASPWIFYQLWMFIAPGLYQREKIYALPFVLASTIFFAGGSFFGYAVVFPLGFQTLLSLGGMLPTGDLRVQPTIMITEYLEFATRMLLAFGIVFEVPVVISFLALAGIVNWKQLIGFGRWWIVIAAVIAGILTPSTDIGSQMMMLVPLIVLYYLGVLVAFLIGPKPEKEEEEPSEAS
jgi:sec-independent protein translocase protein TatC